MVEQLSKIHRPPNYSHCRILEVYKWDRIRRGGCSSKIVHTFSTIILQDWKGCCKDRDISSFVDLISRFIEFVKPQCQTYEDALQNLTVALEDEGFTTEIVEDLRDVYHTQYQEPSDIEGDIYEEGCQPLEEEQDFSHDST